MFVSYICRHFYNLHWNLASPVAFLAYKLLIILFIWSTLPALIFSFEVGGNSF